MLSNRTKKSKMGETDRLPSWQEDSDQHGDNGKPGPATATDNQGADGYKTPAGPGLVCPYCEAPVDETYVSRTNYGRRERHCIRCGKTFWTVEVVAASHTSTNLLRWLWTEAVRPKGESSV